jgi:hypothetical protein
LGILAVKWRKGEQKMRTKMKLKIVINFERHYCDENAASGDTRVLTRCGHSAESGMGWDVLVVVIHQGPWATCGSFHEVQIAL